MKAAGSVLLIVGIAVTALGIYLGLASVTRLRADCGSGFLGLSSTIASRDQSNAESAEQSQTTNDLTLVLEGRPAGEDAVIDKHRLADACQPAIDDRRTLSLLVAVPGAALLIAGWVLLAMSSSPTERRDPVE